MNVLAPLSSLLAKFRTWQIRHRPLGLRPPAGFPVWFVSETHTVPIPGEVAGYDDDVLELMLVKLFFESPLGTDVKTVAVPVAARERLSYRPV